MGLGREADSDPRHSTGRSEGTPVALRDSGPVWGGHKSPKHLVALSLLGVTLNGMRRFISCINSYTYRNCISQHLPLLRRQPVQYLTTINKLQLTKVSLLQKGKRIPLARFNSLLLSQITHRAAKTNLTPTKHNDPAH